MAFTFVGSLSIATAGQAEVRTVMLAALGCSLAWGLVDAVMYVVRTLTGRARNRRLAERIAGAAAAGAQRLLAEAMPPGLMALLGPDEVEGMRCRLAAMDVAGRLLLIRRAATPHVARLGRVPGRVPGTRRYSDAARSPDNEDVPGVLVVRVDAGLLYFNAGHVGDEVRRMIATAGDALRVVVWDLSTSPYVDLAGVRLLGELQRELAARGGELRLVEAHAPVRDMMRNALGRDAGEISRGGHAGRRGDRGTRRRPCGRSLNVRGVIPGSAATSGRHGRQSLRLAAGVDPGAPLWRSPEGQAMATAAATGRYAAATARV